MLGATMVSSLFESVHDSGLFERTSDPLSLAQSSLSSVGAADRSTEGRGTWAIDVWAMHGPVQLSFSRDSGRAWAPCLQGYMHLWFQIIEDALDLDLVGPVRPTCLFQASKVLKVGWSDVQDDVGGLVGQILVKTLLLVVVGATMTMPGCRLFLGDISLTISPKTLDSRIGWCWHSCIIVPLGSSSLELSMGRRTRGWFWWCVHGIAWWLARQ
jgi:hypothetical protein